MLSDLSPAVGFGLVPQSGLVEGVSAAGDVNGDGFEDLWVRVSPPPVDSEDSDEPPEPAEPAESILVYGNASWGAADRVPTSTSGWHDPGDVGVTVWRLGSGQLHALRRRTSGGPGALSSRRPGVG